MGQLSLFTDEILPPDSGSDTSKAAAVKQAPKSERQRQAILALIRHHGDYGATDDEMQEWFALNFDDEIFGPLGNGNTLRPRRYELCGGKHHTQRPELIVDSGQRRKTKAGNGAKVWVIKKGTNDVSIR